MATHDLFFVRTELEARFPTLAFHFFQRAGAGAKIVRVARRDMRYDNIHPHYAEVGAQFYEETIEDWSDWPTDGFIARCCLIA